MGKMKEIAIDVSNKVRERCFKVTCSKGDEYKIHYITTYDGRRPPLDEVRGMFQKDFPGCMALTFMEEVDPMTRKPLDSDREVRDSYPAQKFANKLGNPKKFKHQKQVAKPQKQQQQVKVEDEPKIDIEVPTLKMCAVCGQKFQDKIVFNWKRSSTDSLAFHICEDCAMEEGKVTADSVKIVEEGNFSSIFVDNDDEEENEEEVVEIDE